MCHLQIAHLFTLRSYRIHTKKYFLENTFMTLCILPSSSSSVFFPFYVYFRDVLRPSYPLALQILLVLYTYIRTSHKRDGDRNRKNRYSPNVSGGGGTTTSAAAPSSSPGAAAVVVDGEEAESSDPPPAAATATAAEEEEDEGDADATKDVTFSVTQAQYRPNHSPGTCAQSHRFGAHRAKVHTAAEGTPTVTT